MMVSTWTQHECFASMWDTRLKRYCGEVIRTNTSLSTILHEYGISVIGVIALVLTV